MPLRITAVPADPALLDLPWECPLAEWPADQLVPLPRGISRHVVRFVRLNSQVYAVKEVGSYLANHEFRLLRDLERLNAPAVEAVGIISERETAEGEPLEPALITRHLQFSLPYRALFSRTLRPDTSIRLLDALSVLLVRLHLLGFYWGDCSLSNTLFRRDAGAFAAYLVDAETGELHPSLSDGQRSADVENARVNIAGELMDLQAGALLHESIDVFDTSDGIVSRYEGLWRELRGSSVVGPGERYLINSRIRRLNDLGFDVAELSMEAEADAGGRRVTIAPKVVDAGHHSRRLLRLTGLDAEENQARRLLNDLDSFRSAIGRPDDDEEMSAHQWLSHVFEPVVAAVPKQLRGKLEAAEIFHEVLEHRWFMSEAQGSDVGLDTAIRDYVDRVLTHKPDEKAVLGTKLGTELEPAVDAPGLDDTAELRISLSDL